MLENHYFAVMDGFRHMRQKWYRVVVKSITWFFLNSTDKVMLAFLFSHPLDDLVTVGWEEFVLAIVAYIIIEKIFELLPFGNAFMGMYKDKAIYGETISKTIIKALVWVAIEVLVLEQLLVKPGAYPLTPVQWVITAVTKVIFFVIHERTWRNTNWGNRYKLTQ